MASRVSRRAVQGGRARTAGRTTIRDHGVARRFTRAFAVAALVLTSPLAAAPASGPRPLSDAEHAAVRIAARFLDQGPEAVWLALSSRSPLRAMGKTAALAEIEVRTGPRKGATWQLLSVVPSLKDRAAAFSINFPSGIDETLIMTLQREGSEYRVDHLSITVDPIGPEGSAAATRTTEGPDQGPSAGPLILGLVAFVLGAGVAVARGRFPAAVTPLFYATLLLAGGGLTWAAVRRFAPPRRDHGTGSRTRNEPTNLGRLLNLRRAIAGGDSEAARRAIPRNPTSRESDAILLWNAQVDLQQMRTEDVESTLKYFPPPTNVPLAEILRGRLAFFRSREVDTVLAYERAVNLGPGRDALWYEAAQAFSILGFEDRARAYLERLARIGSREPDVYYTLAAMAAAKEKTDESERLVQQAWHLKPADRRDLIALPQLWAILRKPSVAKLVNVSSAEEPSLASPEMGRRVTDFPVGADLRVIGDFLDVRMGEQDLRVPGGACMAPPTAQVTDAGRWTAAEDFRALDDYPLLVKSTQSPGALTQPLLRLRVEKTASALVKFNRWDDVLALTAGLSPRSENVPTDLLFLRGVALKQKRDFPAVRKLFLELAASPAVRRKADPQQLVEIGEMLAAVGNYEDAIRLWEKAASIREIPFVDDRIRQLSMNQRLASSYATETTEHFEVHYPNDVGKLFAQGIAGILEAEFKRLSKWIPLQHFEPVVVNIVWWQEFRSTYTGSDFILGFYDGKITLPFAGVGGYPPEAVAILSHELAHAMIAQSTNDQAPRWFQEGLAQRIEMVEYAPNALNMYEDDKLISLSLLDAVMQSSPDPDMISEAYIEAQTIIRYIEAEYGTDGISHMLASYRGGARTEDAIGRLTGKDLAAFDTAMRAWGRAGGAKVFVNPPPHRYDDTDEEVIRVNEGKS